MDILLPATDAGAIGQILATILLTVLGAFLLRRHRQAQLFVIGLGVFVFSLEGLRTLH